MDSVFVMDCVMSVETSVMVWVKFVMSNPTDSVKLMETEMTGQ